MLDESVGTDNTVTMTTPRYEEHSADRESPDTLGALRSAVHISDENRVFVFSDQPPNWPIVQCTLTMGIECLFGVPLCIAMGIYCLFARYLVCGELLSPD